jgi:hypothetical protein
VEVTESPEVHNRAIADDRAEAARARAGEDLDRRLVVVGPLFIFVVAARARVRRPRRDRCPSAPSATGAYLLPSSWPAIIPASLKSHDLI